MSGFLYYVPSHKGWIQSEQASAFKFAHAIGKLSSVVETRKGPNGGVGTIATAGSPDVGHYPDRQTWRQIPGSTAWVGYWNDAPPTPQDLERPQMLDGRAVRLADGHDWIVPMARVFTDTADGIGWYTALPQTLTMDQDGRWTTGGIQQQHRRLWDVSEQFATHVYRSLLSAAEDDPERAADQITFDIQAECESAVVALGTNYHVSGIELSMLGALDQTTVEQVLLAVIDWQGFQDIAKKNRPSREPDSLPGEQEVSGTVQRLAS